MNRKVVLIIEDDDAIRTSYRDVLEERGFRAVLAADGQEAMDLLTMMVKRPSVILLDLLLPKKNGWDFLNYQRRLPQFANVPVVICTAFPKTGSSLGAAETLAKPINLKTLVATVERLCA